MLHRKRSNEEDYVKVVRPNVSKCSSKLGRRGGGQVLNLGKNFTSGRTCYKEKIIIHEFIHAIGFTHEQNRHDRDSYVGVKYENIKGGKSNGNFNKRNSNWLTETPYDGKSVMHYSAINGFSIKIDGKKQPTMTSKVCRLHYPKSNFYR